MWGKIFRSLAALFFSLAIVGLGIASTFVLHWLKNLPDYKQLDSLTLGSTTRIFARDGSLLGVLRPTLSNGGKINRTLVSLDHISPYLVAAAVTSEDRRFFEHYGVDPIGIVRGFVKILQGERLEGGSTLTNQLIKVTLLTDYEGARVLSRKIPEWVLSLQVERSFTKEEILQNYLNAVYWGRGGAEDIFGIHAAARAYFRKAPQNLTLAESVYLVTLLPNANRYYDFKAYRTLFNSLLIRMVEDGWITPKEASAALHEKIVPSGWKVTYDSKGNVQDAKLVDKKAIAVKNVVSERAPHFMQQVERDLIKRFGREKVYNSGGLNVYTTLDTEAQNSAERASYAARIPWKTTLGMVMLSPYNGEVLAMVGQKLYSNTPTAEWNNAAQGQRQVGSSIKPLLYTTAINQGLTQAHTELDSKTCFAGNYCPGNFGEIYANSPVSLRYALDHSLNIPTLKLAEKVGLSVFRSKLNLMNLTPPEDAGLSLAIGTLETSPLMMAAAYTPFVNSGIWTEPRYLKRVQSNDGQVLFDSSRDKPERRKVWSPQVAYVGLDMLLGVVNDLGAKEGGLAWKARISGWQVGGKTGTTNDQKDLWFVGVTPEVVGAVWVGKQEGGGLPSNVYSGDYNPAIWQDMVSGYLKNKAYRSFDVPQGIGRMTVNGFSAAYVAQQNASGLASASDTPRYRSVTQLPADSSTTPVAIDSRTGRLADETTPTEYVKIRRVRNEDAGYLALQ